MPTTPFPANAVNLFAGTPGTYSAGSVSIKMLTNKYYTDGSLLKTGLTYSVALPWAQAAISSNWATLVSGNTLAMEMSPNLDVVKIQNLVSGDWIPQAETVLPDEVVSMTASGGVCGAPCYVSRIRCVTGASVALTVYEGAASTATTLLTATLSAGEEATIPNNKLRAINGIRAVFASGSFDFYIGTED